MGIIGTMKKPLQEVLRARSHVFRCCKVTHSRVVDTNEPRHKILTVNRNFLCLSSRYENIKDPTIPEKMVPTPHREV